ncbi:flagellar hook-length control protein FliK [Paucibacter sp. Y2R2-4]|uniref:flagellar hook-length control protein FliK n=1 Tax=Paucibacter sp. Y2R2-4 TaxID=2893553 RepID=UPI0021E3E1DE|nr:flagellar hook-length control protein FliK [Paucibacter sp. Y2R2-4]MCV2351821.1 flagellar hook-length control protein FliK [Paucibacter sp. Y2R2-4]
MSTDTSSPLSTSPGRFKPIARADRPSNGLVPLPKPGEAPAETFSQMLKSYDAAQNQRSSSASSQPPTLSAQLPQRPYPGPAPAPQPPVAPPTAAENAPKPAEGAKPYTGARPQPRNEAQRLENKAAAKLALAGNKADGQAPKADRADKAGKADDARLDETEQAANDIRLSDMSDQPGIRGGGPGTQLPSEATAGLDPSTASDKSVGERSTDLAAAGLLATDKTDAKLSAQALSEADSEDLGTPAKGNANATGVGAQALRAQTKADQRNDSKTAGPVSADSKAQSAATEFTPTSGSSAMFSRNEANASRPEGASFDKLLAANVAATGTSSMEKPSGSGTTEKPQVMMSASLYDTAFAPEMAARLSVLAADGVQEAQLHLNPAEMGPVAVSIVVDGQQAQISFHAEQSDTRQVLEQSLPDLAAALRESGLTLSGGGVFQQPQDQGQAQQGRTQEGRIARGSAQESERQPSLAATPAQSTRVSRGVLDMYA